MIRLAAEECLSKGITSFHDAGASYGTIDIYKKLAEQGRLGVRLYVMISAGDLFLGGRLTQYRIIGAGENHLTVRSVKLLLTGPWEPMAPGCSSPMRTCRGRPASI